MFCNCFCHGFAKSFYFFVHVFCPSMLMPLPEQRLLHDNVLVHVVRFFFILFHEPSCIILGWTFEPPSGVFLSFFPFCFFLFFSRVSHLFPHFPKKHFVERHFHRFLLTHCRSFNKLYSFVSTAFMVKCEYALIFATFLF